MDEPRAALANGPHAPLLHRPRLHPALSKRGRARPALVDDRWQSADDKTRVSSINKRRVTPVPGDVAPSQRGGKASSGRDGVGLRSSVGTWTVESGCSVRSSLRLSPVRRGSHARRERAWLAFESRHGIAVPASTRWVTTPFANDAVNPRCAAVRSRFPAKPTTPRRLPSCESKRPTLEDVTPRARCEWGSGRATIARAIDPASPDFSQETILPWARRATTLFPVDPPPIHTLARTSRETSLPMRSGIEWPELGWLGLGRRLRDSHCPRQSFPSLRAHDDAVRYNPPDPGLRPGTREKSQGTHLSPALPRLVWR